MKQLFILASIVTILSSCQFIVGERVRGNGNVTTDDRSTDGSFETVKSHGSFDIYVSYAANNSIKLEGEDNLLPYIETSVSNGVLDVRTKDGYNLHTTRDIKIYVAGPDFSEIRSYGSGDIIGENKIMASGKLELGVAGSADIKMDLDAPEVDADISGSGDMILSGHTRVFDASLKGSGDISALELKSEETSVHIAGSGNANVYASVKLDVNVAGSGDVNYKGGGTVSSHIAGSGDVKKLD